MVRRTLLCLFVCGCAPLPVVVEQTGDEETPELSSGSENPPSGKEGCIASARPTQQKGVGLAPAFPRLSFANPVALVQAPDSRWFVVEQGGRVQGFVDDPEVDQATEVLDISARVVVLNHEDGLLSLAFHPRFEDTHEVFLFYTGGGGSTGFRSIISRFTMSPSGALDPDSEQIVLAIERAAIGGHNGGNLMFGPDGYLYLATGDGEIYGDPGGNAQNLKRLLGKMLRIDVDGHYPYAIPQTNPFVGRSDALPEIYALGFRNPWRWSFDRLTGRLWLGDVGHGQVEEVNRVVAGGNYGWNKREGTRCFTETSCDAPGLIDPVLELSRSQATSITGGYVYRGNGIPGLRGSYVFGDFITGWIRALGESGGAAPTILESSKAPSSFAEDHDGELLLVDYVDGKIYRLVATDDNAEQTTPQVLPRWLSETGCVASTQPLLPAPGVIPYEVNAPLWSDGADKLRWLALPPNEHIAWGANGDFDLPIGSVAVKTFLFDERPIETRLFMRHADGGWAGYSYAWTADGSDAELLSEGETRLVDGRSWRFPDRSQCVECHTSAAGFTLGLERAQLDRAGQLQQLALEGLLLEAPDDSGPTLVAIDDQSASLQARARSYLHSNCAGCHRAGAGTPSMDLRAHLPLEQMDACDRAPRAGSYGASDTRLIAPGEPERSMLVLRMRGLTGERMPPIGGLSVDTQAISVIEAWIASLPDCSSAEE